MNVRIGIFGGTFDPPHRSHVFAVLWALQSGEVGRVIMVPTARHAFGKEPEATFEERMEMCRLATQEFAAGLVEVVDIEAHRKGPSYMIDTLLTLRSAHPGAQLRLIVGSDILGEMHRWKEPDEVRRIAPLLIVPRLGHAEETELAQLPRLSSTDVRRVLESGEDPRQLLPHRVLEFIRSTGLYRKS